MQVENLNRDELKKRVADMSTLLKKQSNALLEYDEQLVRRLIEKGTIYKVRFPVEFKSPSDYIFSWGAVSGEPWFPLMKKTLKFRADKYTRKASNGDIASAEGTDLHHRQPLDMR